MTMTIKITCGCGKSLQAKPELAGKQVKCPACGEPLVIPKPTATAKKIRVSCECGQTFKAKPELAGRRVKCPSCGDPLSIPKAAAPVSKTSKAPAEMPDADSFGLGELDALVEQSVDAPTRLRQPSKDYEAEANQQAKGTKKKKQRQTDSSMDPLTIVAGVACILHGLGGPAVASRIVWGVASTAGVGAVFNLLLTVPGFVAIAMLVAGLGFIACGVGFLIRLPWAGQLAYTLALTYFGLLTLGLVWQLVTALRFGGGNLLPTILTNAIQHSVPQLIVPGFIIYLSRRN